MKLGEKQVLTVVKIVDFGVYLGSDEERVLLPKKQVPSGIEVGDPIEVFLYKDSSDPVSYTHLYIYTKIGDCTGNHISSICPIVGRRNRKATGNCRVCSEKRG